MDMTDLKDQMRRFNKEVFENGNVDAIDELLTENFIEHQPPPPGVEMKPGREGVKTFLKSYMDAFSDWSTEINQLIQEGDTVVAHGSYTATHTGNFAGIPATNKRITVEGIDIVRFEGDRAAEHWGLIDAASMLTQMGVMPSM